MSTLAFILAIAAGGSLAAIALWIWLARLLEARIHSPLRALPLCLPLLLASAGYGLYWFGFFASPELAVQLHAIRLTLTHAVGWLLPWLAVAWLVAALWPLRPLLAR